MTKRIAVLGCGPAGLLAAHACQLSGNLVDIYSVYRPSPIGGAQFLHREIPGITDPSPDGKVYFVHVGSDVGYAIKVYGNAGAPTSWKEYHDGEHDVWNMRRAYARLWADYEKLIIDAPLDADRVDALVRSYDMVFSTIPLKAICRRPQEHTFDDQPVWISNEDRYTDDNQIVYNGLDPEVAPWYRASKIFGVPGVEYPAPPVGIDAVRVSKPLRNDCTCHPEVTLLGRYGKWQKGELIHHAYEGALKAISNAM